MVTRAATEAPSRVHRVRTPGFPLTVSTSLGVSCRRPEGSPPLHLSAHAAFPAQPSSTEPSAVELSAVCVCTTLSIVPRFNPLPLLACTSTCSKASWRITEKSRLTSVDLTTVRLVHSGPAIRIPYYKNMGRILALSGLRICPWLGRHLSPSAAPCTLASLATRPKKDICRRRPSLTWRVKRKTQLRKTQLRHVCCFRKVPALAQR